MPLAGMMFAENLLHPRDEKNAGRLARNWSQAGSKLAATLSLVPPLPASGSCPPRAHPTHCLMALAETPSCFTLVIFVGMQPHPLIAFVDMRPHPLIAFVGMQPHPLIAFVSMQTHLPIVLVSAPPYPLVAIVGGPCRSHVILINTLPRLCPQGSPHLPPCLCIFVGTQPHVPVVIVCMRAQPPIASLGMRPYPLTVFISVNTAMPLCSDQSFFASVRTASSPLRQNPVWLLNPLSPFAVSTLTNLDIRRQTTPGALHRYTENGIWLVSHGAVPLPVQVFQAAIVRVHASAHLPEICSTSYDILSLDFGASAT
ncbi:hypothetical protein DFH09DRAFT_1324158 [Mycena vulgaris]|nr:hypothetical protein DFH09DRAFT_1324158 [Mycena vulgaris]